MSISKLSYVFAASTLLLAGCGGSAAPTGNSSGPASGASNTSGAAGGNAALLAALDNMVAAKTAFRYESSNTTKGNFGGPGAQGGQAATPGERTVKTMGEVNGRNSHITTQGNFGGGAGNGAAGGGSNELIFVDGKTFVKGPNQIMGAPEAKWYELPADRAQRNPAEGLFARDGKRLIEPADFKKTTSETIDGKRCDIYEADAAALQRIYEATQTGFGVGGFGGPGGGAPGPQGGAQAGQGQGQGQNAGQGGGQGGQGSQGRNQLTIKSGSYKVWACEDNLVRKYEVNFALTSAQRADQALEIQSSTRLYDFGSAINIAAPAGASMAESPNRPNNPANGTPRAPGTPRAGTPRP